VKLIAFDFDGVFTDGMVYVDQNGKESVRCSRKDGMGIALLKKNNIPCVVISTEKNPVVAARCEKLQLDYFQGVDSALKKREVLERYCVEREIVLSDVAYVGDDINDAEVLRVVGYPMTVADGHHSLDSIVVWKTSRAGGGHAVREICEYILMAKGVLMVY